MNPKKLVASCIGLLLCFGISGCSNSTSSTQSAPQNSTEEAASSAAEALTEDTSQAITEEKEDPQPQTLNVGDTVQNDKFTVTLTSARVDSTLASDQSPTSWQPGDGGCFVILEFDVTALTSDQLPVDDYAITKLAAKYNEDVYQNWQMQYISSQLWLSFRHTYLDANLPCHVYAYTTVPLAALDSGSLSVTAAIAEQPISVVIR